MGKTREQRQVEKFNREHDSARFRLKQAADLSIRMQMKALPDGVLSSKQEPEEGDFNKNIMDKNELLTPPYDPSKLYSMVENSQILPQCIDAMVQNIHGFGYDFIYVGDSPEREIATEEITEKKNLKEFFNKVNENQSFTTVAKDMHEDLEKTGNGYIEIVRDNKGSITLLYRMDARAVRLQKIQSEEVPIKCEFFRYGKLMNLTIYKRFRKFAMLNGKTGNKVNMIWFKEFGDPRPMDKYTGSYDKVVKGNEASEALHFKIGTDTYGIPRWSGQVLVTLGMANAEFVNYDLFANQVVPPLAIMVSGGVLTAESIKDIQNVLVQKKGVQNFNKVLLLESASKGTISEKDSASIELKELSQARKEDGMFTEYLSGGAAKVRSAFRLPPMILGKAECFQVLTTRVLTLQGWKYSYEWETGTEIATFNPDTKQMEFRVPNKKVVYNYDGDMCHFESQKFQLTTTPNHDMWIKKYSATECWEKAHAEEVIQRTEIVFQMAPPNGCEVCPEVPHIIIPYRRRKFFGGREERYPEGHERVIPMNDWLKLIGFHIGDGHLMDTPKSGYGITFGCKKQRKKVQLDELYDTFSKIDGMICSKNSGYNNRPDYTFYIFRDVALTEYIREECGTTAKTKRIPQNLMLLNNTQSLLLLSSLISTDGSPTKGLEHTGFGEIPHSCKYATISKKLAEQVQVLSLKCGYRAMVSIESRDEQDMYIVNISKSAELHIDRRCSNNTGMQYFKGEVFCFDVPNHLFFVEQNGRVSVQGNSYSKSCYDEETQTLTDNGWKYYWEVTDQDRIATYNPINSQIEYHYPNGGLRVFDHDGSMVHFCNRNIDCVVTLNHDMWFCNQFDYQNEDQKWHKTKAENLIDVRGKMLNAPMSPRDITSPALEEMYIPYVMHGSKSTNLSTTDYRQPIPMDLFMELIGWIITDGSLTTINRPDMRYIGFGFTKQRKIRKINRLFNQLENLGYICYYGKPQTQTGVVSYHINDPGLYYWVEENIGRGAANKRLPFNVCDLHQDHADILLDTLIFCDGTEDQREGCNSDGYYSSSSLLIDQVQELALVCGNRVHKINDNRLSITYKKPIFEINKHQSEVIQYTGKVYCFNVPNHLFVTRRNGKIAIQGNTADSSKQVAEEQVFVPERKQFDAVINNTLLSAIGATVWEYKSQFPKMLRGQDVTETFNNFARFGVFTINQAIKLANKVLNVDLQEYDKTEEWANYPVSIVMEYARQGVLDVGELSNATSNIASIIGDPANTDDPEKAAQIYVALNQITSELGKIQEENNKEGEQYDM